MCVCEDWGVWERVELTRFPVSKVKMQHIQLHLISSPLPRHFQAIPNPLAMDQMAAFPSPLTSVDNSLPPAEHAASRDQVTVTPDPAAPFTPTGSPSLRDGSMDRSSSPTETIREPHPASGGTTNDQNTLERAYQYGLDRGNLEQEINQVMGTLNNWWGGVKKQACLWLPLYHHMID